MIDEIRRRAVVTVRWTLIDMALPSTGSPEWQPPTMPIVG